MSNTKDSDDNVHCIPFGSATFIFDEKTTSPVVIKFRLPSLQMALIQRYRLPNESLWDVPGIYFLISPGVDSSTPRIYIGQSSNVSTRIAQHLKGREDWDRALVVIADRSDGFSTAEIEWLEGYFYDCFRERIGKDRLGNKTNPSNNSLPAIQQKELFVIAQPIDAILRLLGIISPSTEPEVEKEEPSKEQNENLGKAYPVNKLSWVDAALEILPEDGSSLHVKEIVRLIQEQNLRDFSNTKTPENTARRDLRVNSQSPNPSIKQTDKSTFARN